jgi:RimJ/RimL family protein N-acetyltransferase
VNSLERTTERLFLRRWSDADRAPFADLNADEEVMRHFPAVLDRKQSDALADRADAAFDARGFGLWALERLDTAEFIGFAGLAPMPEGVPGEGEVEVGWRLARAHWGHGFATEAARAALAFAFDELQVERVHSMTAVTNLRSQAVMKRLGMHLADHFDHPRIEVGSAVRPHVRYVIDAPS